jgi:hypothetical protein
VVAFESPPDRNPGPLDRTTQRAEAHGCATHAHVIAQLRSQAIAHEHAKRLARARNVTETGLELIEIEQARMSVQQCVQDCPLG